MKTSIVLALSMEENATGRFLKANSGQDKTRAGKMMAAVGKSQSFSAQQRYTSSFSISRYHLEFKCYFSWLVLIQMLQLSGIC